MRESLMLLKQRMEQLFWKVAEEGESIRVDGEAGFNDRAQFTNGKVINLCAYVAAQAPKGSQQQEAICQAARRVIAFTAWMKMETWGMLNAMEGLYRLHQCGLLDACVDAQTMDILKRALDWRVFVDEQQDFALKHLPTNYYGVAFGVARYRELLGWEPVKYGGLLLDRLMTHITRYSGAYGFMDETQGDGRFDRYSILIPAEITALVLDTGWQEPELMRSMLDSSAHIVLQFASEQGTGFAYGRSIGAYGETAALQILSTAAALGGILNETETIIAHGYCCSILRRMTTWWYDEAMQSVNLWEKGRKTDGYRNKNRILGENISLSMQMIQAIEQWQGCREAWASPQEGWTALAQSLPACVMTQFAAEPLPRSLTVIRDGDVVWQLPAIGGGEAYSSRDPYLPVPRANFLLEAVPDADHAAWVPCLILRDGSRLVPTGRVDAAELVPTPDGCQVRLHQQGWLQLGSSPATWVQGADISTVYTFAHGSVQREDTIRLNEEMRLQAEKLCLVCDVMRGTVEAQGFQREAHLTYAEAAQQGICLDTPHGACREQCIWERDIAPENEIIRISWRLTWKA